MATATFERALALVLAHEGGYVNHPADPGGATNRGVTQGVYDSYRRARELATRSVRDISAEEVREIYRRQYWDAVRGDELPAGIDYAAFDYAVNSGPARAAKDLQRVLGVAADGIVGLRTLAAAHAAARADEERVITDLCSRRLAFVRGLKTFKTFGRGWTNRIMGARDGFQPNDKGVIDYAIMIARADFAYGLPRPAGQAKADPAEAKVTATAEGHGVAVTGASALGAACAEAAQQLAPLSGTLAVVKWLFLGLTLAGIGFGLYATVRRIQAGGA